MAISWYAVPGERASRPSARAGARDRDAADAEEPSRAARAGQRSFTLPPEAILIRRMHGIVAIVLHAAARGRRLGRDRRRVPHGDAPATALGQAEADFFARRGQTAGPAG